jgi:hypothetical protein
MLAALFHFASCTAHRRCRASLSITAPACCANQLQSTVTGFVKGYQAPRHGATKRRLRAPYIMVCAAMGWAGLRLTPCCAVHCRAQDVVTFLHWCSMPELDERKQMGIKAIALSAVMFGFAAYLKRLRWSHLKSRRVVVDVVN